MGDAFQDAEKELDKAMAEDGIIAKPDPYISLTLDISRIGIYQMTLDLQERIELRDGSNAEVLKLRHDIIRVCDKYNKQQGADDAEAI